MNPRANKFLSLACPCGAEIGQPCKSGSGTVRAPDYVRRIRYFDGQEYLAKLQAEEDDERTLAALKADVSKATAGVTLGIARTKP